VLVGTVAMGMPQGRDVYRYLSDPAVVLAQSHMTGNTRGDSRITNVNVQSGSPGPSAGSPPPNQGFSTSAEAIPLVSPVTQTQTGAQVGVGVAGVPGAAASAAQERIAAFTPPPDMSFMRPFEGDHQIPPVAHGDMNMLMKAISLFAPQLPKLEPGGESNKAYKLRVWFKNIEEALKPGGDILMQWWQWCVSSATKTYDAFLLAPIQERVHLRPTTKLPSAWVQLDAIMRPHLLTVIPGFVKEWTSQQAQVGTSVETSGILYHLLIHSSPGDISEKDQLLRRLVDPNPCTQAKAAYKELEKWEDAGARCLELRILPPDIEQLQR